MAFSPLGLPAMVGDVSSAPSGPGSAPAFPPQPLGSLSRVDCGCPQVKTCKTQRGEVTFLRSQSWSVSGRDWIGAQAAGL